MHMCTRECACVTRARTHMHASIFQPARASSHAKLQCTLRAIARPRKVHAYTYAYTNSLFFDMCTRTYVYMFEHIAHAYIRVHVRAHCARVHTCTCSSTLRAANCKQNLNKMRPATFLDHFNMIIVTIDIYITILAIGGFHQY